jgi:hypothetical protein
VRRWREKGYLRSAAGRITEESLEAFCRDHPEKIPYDELGEHVQLWLRDLGYPAVDGFSPRELADKLNVSRRQVAYWLRHCWLREINGKIPLDSLRRFCRAHSDQIPYATLDPETQEWLRSMGYQRALAGAQPAPVAEAPANLPEPQLSGSPAVVTHRQLALDAACETHPDRFVRRAPKPLPLPSAVWINKPVPPGEKTQEKGQ